MSQASDYDYDLPRDLIAQQPLAERSHARLMIVDRKRGELTHRHVENLPELLAPEDCLVVNDTRVVPARLLGRRARTGGRWEGLFLSADDSGRWRLLGRTRGRITPGESVLVEAPDENAELELRLLSREADGIWLAHPTLPGDAPNLLQRFGRVPLPCYIRGGQMTDADRQRYQTVYARVPGSAAAPTAGLHLDQDLIARLAEHGVPVFRVTLHIGLDTFRPLQTDDLASHVMHSEWGRIEGTTAAALNERRATSGRIVAVGTTSVRVLETTAAEAAARGHTGLAAWSGHTQLFIRPPYRFQAVDALLTNFHLPRSTLLVLVSAFAGRELIRHAYETAIAERYRFFSYGDAMLIV